MDQAIGIFEFLMRIAAIIAFFASFCAAEGDWQKLISIGLLCFIASL